MTGSFTPSLVVSHVAVCAHRSCRTNAPPACTCSCPRFAGTKRLDKSSRNRFVRVARCSRRNVALHESRSRRRTIARLMLAPCSASSMLFASLRPGRRPGLRALTTPPRGTSRLLRDGRLSDDSVAREKRLTRESRRRIVGVITSVPHGTSSVRRHGQRSAHPVGAHRARHRAQPSQHRSPVARPTDAVSRRALSCEHRDLSRRIVLRIMRRERLRSPAASRVLVLAERLHRRSRATRRPSPLGAQLPRDDAGFRPASALTRTSARRRHIDAPERAIPAQHESS